MSRLSELPQSFQECREYRHQWQPSNVIQGAYQIEEVQVCPRCGNERFRYLSTRKRDYGYIIQRWHMRYRAHDYLLKKEDKPTNDEWGLMRMNLLGFEPK